MLASFLRYRICKKTVFFLAHLYNNYYFQLQSSQQQDEHARRNIQPHVQEEGSDNRGKMEALNNRLQQSV